MHYKTPFVQWLSLFIFLPLLISCGEDQAFLLDSQRWNGINLFVEVRPTPPSSGMNEFLVVTTLDDKKPAWNLIISIKSNKGDTWIQMIQDGHTGVFRRATYIEDPKTDILIVRLQAPDKTGELRFPMFVNNQTTTAQ